MKKNNIITKIKISSDQKLIPSIKGIENEYDTSTLITNGGVIIKGGVNISNASILINNNYKNKPKKINHSLPGTMGISNFYDNNINDCKNSFYGLIEDNKVIYFGEDKGIKGQKGIKGNKGEKGIKGIFGQKGIRGQKGEEGYDPIIIFHGDLTEDLINYVENNYYPSYINNGSLDIKFNKLIGTEPFNPDSYNEWNNNLIYIQLVDNDKRNCDNDKSCNSNENKYVKINCCSNNCGNCNNIDNSKGLSKYLIYWNGKSWSRSNYEFTALNGEVGQIGQIGIKGVLGNKGNKNIINNIGSNGYKGDSASDSVNIKGDNPDNGIRGNKGDHGFNSIIIYTGELNSIIIGKIQDNNYPVGKQNNPTFNNLIGNESFNPNGYTKWNTTFKYIQYVTIDNHFDNKYTNLLFSYDGSNFDIMNINNSQNNNFKGQKGSNNINNTIGKNGSVIPGDIGELSKVKGDIGFVNFNKEFKGSLIGCNNGFDINYNKNIIFNEQNPIFVERISLQGCRLSPTKPWYNVNGGKITITSLINKKNTNPPNESYNKGSYGCIKFNNCYKETFNETLKGTSFGNITPTFIYGINDKVSIDYKPQIFNLLPFYNKTTNLYGSTQNNPITFTDNNNNNNNTIIINETVSDSDGNKADTTYLSLPVYTGKSTDTTSIEASINIDKESIKVSHYSNLYLPKIHPIDTESSDLSHYEYLNKPNIPNYVDLSGLIGIPEPIINSLPEDFFNTLTLTISEFEDDKKNDTEQITFNNIISIDNGNINYIVSYNPLTTDRTNWENSVDSSNIKNFPDINTNFLNLMQNKPYLIFCRKDSSTYNTLNKIELQITVNVNSSFSYFQNINTDLNKKIIHIDFVNNETSTTFLNNSFNLESSQEIIDTEIADNIHKCEFTSDDFDNTENFKSLGKYISDNSIMFDVHDNDNSNDYYRYISFDFFKLFPGVNFKEDTNINLEIIFPSGLENKIPRNVFFSFNQVIINLDKTFEQFVLKNVKSIKFHTNSTQQTNFSLNNSSEYDLITNSKDGNFKSDLFKGYVGLINNIFNADVQDSPIITRSYIYNLININTITKDIIDQPDFIQDFIQKQKKKEFMLTSYNVTIENINLVNDFSDSTSKTMYLFNYHNASDSPILLSIKYNKYFAWLYSGIFGNSFYSKNTYKISNCNVSAYVGIKQKHWEEYNPNIIYSPVQQKNFNDYVYYNKYYMCYGGLIGAVIFSNNVSIESCQFNGNIGYGLTGGIVGCIAYSQCTISNCKTNIHRIENRGDSEENDTTTMYNIDLTNTVGEISNYPIDTVTQDDMKYLKKISNRYNTYVSGGIVGLLYMSVGTSYTKFIDENNNINFNIGKISGYNNNKFVNFDINNTNSDWKLFYGNGKDIKFLYLNCAYYIASDIYDTLTSMLYLYSNVMEFKDSDNNIFKFPDTTINIDNKNYPSIINCSSLVDVCSNNSGSIVGHLINSSIINCSGRVSGSLVGRYSQTMPPMPPKQGDPIDYTKQLYSVSHNDDNLSCYISNCISSIGYGYDFTKGLICREFAGADDPTKNLVIVKNCFGMYITNGQININFDPPGNNSNFNSPDNISFYSNGVNGIDPNIVYNFSNQNYNIISYSRDPDTSNKSSYFYIDIRNFMHQAYNNNYKIYLVSNINDNITRVGVPGYLLKYTAPLLDNTNEITLDKFEFQVYISGFLQEDEPAPETDPEPTPNFDPAPSGNDIIISDITMNITVINKFDPIAIDGNFIINEDISNSVNLNTLYTCYPLLNKDDITVSILSHGKCGGLLQPKCAFKINKYTDSTGKIEYDLEYDGSKINRSGEILLAINEKNGKNQYNFKVSYTLQTDTTKNILQGISSLNIIDNYENTTTKTVMKRMIKNEQNILKSIYSGLVISNPDQNTEISNYNYVREALNKYIKTGSTIDNTIVKFKSLYSIGMIKDETETHPILFWTSANQINEFKIIDETYKNLSNFTGQHIVKPSTRFVHKNIDKLYGKIVSSIGTYNNYLLQNNKANINDSMPIIELSNKEKDKRVIGVITNKTNNGNKYNDKDFFNNKYIKINSLGDGMIWVSNINGNFEAGDFITTSKIDGIGQRQDDNICYNYTVAKITSDLDFKNSNNVKEIKLDTQLIKFKLVECIYLCG